MKLENTVRNGWYIRYPMIHAVSASHCFIVQA